MIVLSFRATIYPLAWFNYHLIQCQMQLNDGLKFMRDVFKPLFEWF